MDYTVNLLQFDNGELEDSYVRGFDTFDEALDYYHDIDLQQEFSVEFICCGGDFKTKKLVKEMFDPHGTQIHFDYYDFKRYKGGD